MFIEKQPPPPLGGSVLRPTGPKISRSPRWPCGTLQVSYMGRTFFESHARHAERRRRESAWGQEVPSRVLAARHTSLMGMTRGKYPSWNMAVGYGSSGEALWPSQVHPKCFATFLQHFVQLFTLPPRVDLSALGTSPREVLDVLPGGVRPLMRERFGTQDFLHCHDFSLPTNVGKTLLHRMCSREGRRIRGSKRTAGTEVYGLAQALWRR